MSLSITQDADRGSAGDNDLFAQAQAGCGDSLNRLMARHDGLVHAVIRKQFLGLLSFAEALQAGRIGLWHAIMGYDPQRGYAFSTYACPCIARQVWRAVEQARQETERDHRERDGIARMTAIGQDADPLAAAEAAAVSAALADLLARLPGDLHAVIVQHNGLEGHSPATFRQIGAALGLSRQRIHQVHGAALIWLRQPAHSHILRSLLGRHTLADYESAQAQSDAWRARRRRRHGR
jgi:RNA polymerase sigma factor (sigma-70 family)